MIWGNSWILIALIAVTIDFILGELPGKHPVQYIGDFINWFQKIAYKKSVLRGAILVALLALIIGTLTLSIQFGLMILVYKFELPKLVAVLVLGVLSSTGIASKTLKEYVKRIIDADDPDKKREYLSIIVTRNTIVLDDKKVYTSAIESHAENLSDGVIAPLFYLILFGFPGIILYKTISTMDSMIGYKNEKYEKFGKVAAITDDILNYIPARLTAFLIWVLSPDKTPVYKLVQDAKIYSTSPNAGYPVAAAAYNLGVKLGGPVYYGNDLVNKAEVGEEKTDNYKDAALNFLEIHSNIEKIIFATLTLSLLLLINIKL